MTTKTYDAIEATAIPSPTDAAPSGTAPLTFAAPVAIFALMATIFA
ncbi:unannotated protein [freshwater metagenome]|uniref:Unannotated protein n=1 Tax=freshwater metagenome TaxID=449393 RepID=A0A6J7JTL6_9ZZZZ